MSLRMLQVPLTCGGVAFLGLISAAVLWVTARRPVDDRDALLRNLPPPSQPLSIRVDHLRLTLRQEMIKYAKIEAAIAVVLIIGGLATAASDQASIGESVARTGAIIVFIVVPWAILTGLYLLARYRGAQLRLRNDVVRHGSGGQPPAVPSDA